MHLEEWDPNAMQNDAVADEMDRALEMQASRCFQMHRPKAPSSLCEHAPILGCGEHYKSLI